MQDRAHAAAVLVADVVQHEALAAVEADPQPPLLPVDRGAVDDEARAVGLGDADLAHVVAQRPEAIGAELAVPGGQRDRVAVLEVDELAGGDVDQAEDPVQRAGVGVAARVRPRVGEDPGQAPPGGPLLLLEAVVAGRDRVDVDGRQLLDPPPAHRGDECRRGPHGVLDGEELVLGHLRLDAGQRPPGADGPGLEVDRRLDRDRGPGVIEDRLGAAGRRARRCGLDRLEHRQRHEADARRRADVGAQQRHGTRDLGGVQRIERVTGAGGGGDRGAHHHSRSANCPTVKFRVS